MRTISPRVPSVAHTYPPVDANLFRTAFTDAQETNKAALGGNTSAVPEVVESDAPDSTVDTTESSTGAPIAKGKEAEPSAEEELPTYKDEGVAAPVEKTEIVQGEEVKEPTSEVSLSRLSSPPY